MRPQRTVGSTIFSIVLIWAMIAIAGAAFWPVYRDVRFIILVAGALIGGTLVAALGARFRWQSYVVVAATFVVFLLSGVQLAVPGRATAGVLPSLAGLADLLGGVALGWKQLLTITLPVGAYQALLVPAFVLILTTTVVGVSVALRARFGELAVIAPVVAFLVAIAFGSAQPLWPVPLALGMLVTVLTFLIWHRWRRRREAIRALARATPDAAGHPLETAGDGVLGVRTIIAGGVILAIAAASSFGATLIAPVTGSRDVLRTAIEQPFDPRNYPSPLAGFRRYLRDDRADQVMMRVQGLPDGALVRVATLDSYDGVVYAVGSAAVDSSSGTFVRIPQAVDQSAVSGTSVDVNVEIENYRGVWVPTVGDFSSIDFGGNDAASHAGSFYYNATSGTAAVLTGLSTGDSYKLHAVIPNQPTEASLADASPGDAVVPRVQGLPEELSLYLEDKVRLLSSPGDRLLAMLAALRTDGYISHGLNPDEPSSRSGHAADRIAELVTAPQMIGDAEQYAVAAALMARQLGFPARVVFGFAPQNGVVTGADVTAWIEVDTAQYGWVAVNPVPEDRPIPAVVPEEQSQVARPPSVVPPPPDRPDQQVDQSAPDSAQDTPDVLDPVLVALLGIARVTGITLLVAGVLIAPFLVIIAAKARRRRLRRTAPTVVQRISGGWDEFADAVVDHGFTPPPAATRSELAAVAGGLPSRVLAAVTDRAVFAPELAEAVDANRVWDTVADLRLTLDQGLTRRQRLRALVSVRSLGAYSVRSLFRREARER